MNSVLKFNKSYFILAILLLTIEVFIAIFIHDRIVRPYIGDFLVVILIYCFFKSFLNISPVKTAIAVLLIAYGIEILQHFNLVERLGLGQSAVAKAILGSSFEWTDIIMYTIGVAAILFVEKSLNRDFWE
jgi:hypothetical protein